MAAAKEEQQRQNELIKVLEDAVHQTETREVKQPNTDRVVEQEWRHYSPPLLLTCNGQTLSVKTLHIGRVKSGCGSKLCLVFDNAGKSCCWTPDQISAVTVEQLEAPARTGQARIL